MQDRGEPSPDMLENFPGMQLVHADDPSRAYVPAWQTCEQLVLCVLLLNLPAAQGAHTLAPDWLEKVPIEHTVQFWSGFSFEKVPGRHRVHLEVPLLSAYEPGLHETQDEVPLFPAYVPTAQRSHDVLAFCSLNFPGAHLMH